MSAGQKRTIADRLKTGSAIALVLMGLAALSLRADAIPEPVANADVAIYGCTPAGITAAIAVKRERHSVVLVCRDSWVGGMSTNGLGRVDVGDPSAIGGLARQFYRDVKAYYLQRGMVSKRPSSFGGLIHQLYSDVKAYYTLPAPPAQPDADLNTFGGLVRKLRHDVKIYLYPSGDDDAQWTFEPHVAEAVYEGWLKRNGIVTLRNFRLRLDKSGVVKRDQELRQMIAEDGRRVSGKIFIDASYEGDLLGMAGVSFATGREANAQYGETLNGNQPKKSKFHNFKYDIDPYVVPGLPKSGLLPRVEAASAGEEGAADNRIQAYNFRLCLTKRPDNRVPFQKPKDYDPRQYEILARYYRAGWHVALTEISVIPNGKIDSNNTGAFSFDDIGMNYNYPTGSYAERERIFAEHRTYEEGLLWFLQNDPRVPAEERAAVAPWGLCADEFTTNGHWSRELYVREARRMVGVLVMTERHLRGLVPTPKSVGLGSYNMDSHNVRRYVDARGFVRNEGNIEVNPGRNYEISYDALTPRRQEARNLLVPVAVSASHIAYGSIRMEPVFMILGESVGTAAVQALNAHSDVQDVDYPTLERRLLAEGQVLHSPARH